MAFTLPTTGASPKIATKSDLEALIDTAIKSVAMATTTGFPFFESIELGLAGTSDGEGFSTSDGYQLVFYRNDAGSETKLAESWVGYDPSGHPNTALTVDDSENPSFTPIQTSSVDTTTGAIMLVGAFGVGRKAGAASNSVLNDTNVVGFYAYSSADANKPGSAGGMFRVERYSTSWVAQFSFSANTPEGWSRQSKDNGATWSAWKKYIGSELNNAVTFSTRSDFVSWAAAKTPAIGTVAEVNVGRRAGTIRYVYDGSSSDLLELNLAGWSAVAPVYLEHYGMVTADTEAGAVVDYSVEFQAALDATHGDILATGWIYLADQVVWPAHAGFEIMGDIVEGGIVTDSALGTSTKLINFGEELGPHIKKLHLFVRQPAGETDRAELFQNDFLMDFSDASRGKIDYLRISQGYNGILAQDNVGGSNPGGWTFGKMEIGCFNEPINTSGALDFIKVEHLALWPFGFAGDAGLMSIFLDGMGVSTFSTVDGLIIDAISPFKSHVVVGEEGNTSILPFTMGFQLDGDGARLTLKGGKSIIRNPYSTKSGAATATTITAEGGEHFMFGPHMHGNEPLMLDVLDGAEMTVNGGVMAQITGNRRGAIVRSGGTLRLHGTDFKFPDSTGTVPFIEQEAGGVLQLMNCTAPEGYSNKRVVVEVNSDERGNYIDGMSLANHTILLPTARRKGNYIDVEQTTITRSSGGVYRQSKIGAGEGFEQQYHLARGNPSAPTTIGIGDVIFDEVFFGYDGSSDVKGATRRVKSEAAVATDNVKFSMEYLFKDGSGGDISVFKMQPSGVTLGKPFLNKLFVYQGAGSFGDETYELQVQSDGASVAKVQAGATDTAYLALGDKTDSLSNGLAYNNSLSELRIRAGNSNRLVVKDGGDILIPTIGTYADNAAAVSAGKAVGTLYIRTGHGLDIVV